MITQYAFAKLNFNLHVLPKFLPNGYHQVKLLNLQANLSDKITVAESNQGIKLICSQPDLATDEANLAYKAAKVVMEECHPRGGVTITLEKNIPITSGLGGGSADGAAVILALDKLWKLNLTNDQKIDFAKTLGMDVCYCVIGGICLLAGAGEIVKPLNMALPKINIIVITPEVRKPSTAWSYTLLNSLEIGKHLEKLAHMIKAMEKNDLEEMVLNLHNDFEKPIIREFPEVAKIKAKMRENGALGTNLSGAGLSVFGIWKDQKSAQTAFQKLKKIYPQTFLTKTV